MAILCAFLTFNILHIYTLLALKHRTNIQRRNSSFCRLHSDDTERSLIHITVRSFTP